VSQEKPLVFICSVELEAAPLRTRLTRAEGLIVGRKPAWRGSLGGREAVILVGGMGKTNAAQALTAHLEREPARGVIGFGVGGAYPGSALDTDGVAIATEEIYGDEGVETPAGWISTEGIGIPLLEAAGARTFNRFRLEPDRVSAAAELLRSAGITARSGAFVTVSTCSGTARRGLELAGRHGAVCETMEGAAYAHVAALYAIPFLEVRGISNLVEDRDLSRWRLQDAAFRAAEAAALLVDAF
jgi:futalosine hydrolase